MAPIQQRVAVNIEVGDLLDARYRLDQHCRTVGDKQLWRATDEVLGRTVAIHLIAGRTRTDAKLLAAAAGRAGGVPDARWVRILDVGSSPAGRQITVWVVSERVDGQTLSALVRREPLRERVATYLIAACAHAVAAAEAAEAHHGGLHPDEVLIPADGNPRLTGLETHDALDPYAENYDDVVGLGALLFAALTGRWPLSGWRGLPAANKGDGVHRGGSVIRLGAPSTRWSPGHSTVATPVRPRSPAHSMHCRRPRWSRSSMTASPRDVTVGAESRGGWCRRCSSPVSASPHGPPAATWAECPDRTERPRRPSRSRTAMAQGPGWCGAPRQLSRASTLRATA